MSKVAQGFRQRDVSRPLRAAKEAGLDNVRIEFPREGGFNLVQISESEARSNIAKNAADVVAERLK
jgi:hypothetical protein